MRLFKASLPFCGILLCCSNYAWAEDSRLIPSYQSNPPVYRVYSNGEFDTVFPPAKSPSSNTWTGIQEVLISPTQQKIAFCKDNDLWVYDVATKIALQLTHIGKPATSQFDSIEVSVQRWSSDESKILILVSRGFTDSPQERKAKYGLQVFDMKTGKTSLLPSSIKHEKILVWFENGNYLLKNNGDVVQYDIASKHQTNILSISSSDSAKDNIEMGQENLSGDQQWIAFDRLNWTRQTSQLMRMNLKSGEIIAITDIGGWAEYQWPIFSPSGKKIVYEHQTNSKPNPNGPSRLPQSDLVIDGKTVYSFEGYRKLYWIDESTIVLIGAIITVIDTDAGIVKAKFKLN